MPRSVTVDAVVVAFRCADADDDSEEVRPSATVSADVLGRAVPWRRFRWRHGQKHFSGTYWADTVSGPVIYESRLELARLLIADFDRSMHRIVAQPFFAAGGDRWQVAAPCSGFIVVRRRWRRATRADPGRERSARYRPATRTHRPRECTGAGRNSSPFSR